MILMTNGEALAIIVWGYLFALSLAGLWLAINIVKLLLGIGKKDERNRT